MLMFETILLTIIAAGLIISGMIPLRFSLANEGTPLTSMKSLCNSLTFMNGIAMILEFILAGVLLALSFISAEEVTSYYFHSIALLMSSYPYYSMLSNSFSYVWLINVAMHLAS